MASATVTAPQSKSVESGSGTKPIVLGLLVFSVFINYIDRGNLSIAAPLIKDELGLSASQLGILLSAFFWTYGLSQILAGYLVDRIDVNWVMAAGFFLWSAATGATGLLHGFAALLAVRLILGVGESVAYPSYSKILTRHFPLSQRAFANAVIASGLSSGPAFGMLLGGMLMARFGWRSFFISVGLISLLWLVPWFRWMPRGPGLPSPAHSGRSPGTLEILGRRSAWSTFVGLFSTGYSLYFLLAWLPYYLVRERQFSMDAMARIGGALYISQAAFAALSGRWSNRRIARGGSASIHKLLLVAGSIATGLLLVASALVGPRLLVGLLMLLGMSVGVGLANIWPVSQILAGPDASGRWTGLQCAFGNLSGAVAAAVTGYVKDRTGHFVWAFVVAAGISWIGALSWSLAGRVEPINWSRPDSDPGEGGAVVVGR